jgi:hypothetical protein
MDLAQDRDKWQSHKMLTAAWLVDEQMLLKNNSARQREWTLHPGIKIQNLFLQMHYNRQRKCTVDFVYLFQYLVLFKFILWVILHGL